MARSELGQSNSFLAINLKVLLQDYVDSLSNHSLKIELYDTLVYKNISAAKATVSFNQSFWITVITLHFCVKIASDISKNK